MNANNQDLTYIINFTVTLPRNLWDNAELSFSNDDYSFYDADFISEVNDTVTASIKLESETFFSNIEHAKQYFIEYSETMPNPQIEFDGFKPYTISTTLYSVKEYGI